MLVSQIGTCGRVDSKAQIGEEAHWRTLDSEADFIALIASNGRPPSAHKEIAIRGLTARFRGEWRNGERGVKAVQEVRCGCKMGKMISEFDGIALVKIIIEPNVREIAVIHTAIQE